MAENVKVSVATATTVVDNMNEIASVEGKSVPMQMFESANNSNPTSISLLDDNGRVNYSLMKEEDKQKYANLVKGINTNDINSVVNYGSQLQTTMNRSGNNLLTAVRANHAGPQMESLINNLLADLSVINVDELKPQTGIKRFLYNLPVIRHFAKSINKILQKYDTIEKSVDNISNQILATRMVALRDNNALQKMFQDNIEHIKQIEDLIVAAKIKQEEINATLQEMQMEPERWETYQISDMNEFALTLDRRISDLITLHYVKKQSLPQIRLIQNNNIHSANRAQSIISTTIPIWKDSLAMAVALNNQKGGIEAQNKMDEATNQLLLHISEQMHQQTIEIAKASEKAPIQIETLKRTTQQLIDTIREVKEVHERGIQERREAEAEIMRIEGELEQAIQAQNASQNNYFLK